MIGFRRINGRNVPILGASRGVQGGVSRLGRYEAPEATCFLTRCPQKCGQDVFFLRHNGGSVWIDPPLGYPWNKHECMYLSEVRAGRSLALVSLPQNNTRHRRAKSLLAVVAKAAYLVNRSMTMLQLVSGKTDRWFATVRKDRQFLLGELVIVDRATRTVARYDAPNIPYRLLHIKRQT
jgi:hypothetical protein